MTYSGRLAAVAACGLLGLTAAVSAQSPNPTMTVEQAQAAFKGDVHQAAGLTCTACHSPSEGTHYVAPPRTSIPKLCGSCHSNAAYIKNFNPQLRVDQYARYLTSMHGQQIAKGETRVAVCSDCHGAHGILPVKDPRAPVYPTNVAKTCGKCHSDASRMTPFGVPISPPTDWAQSVHAKALLEGGDTSAPTCSTCHGSHGAAPPEVESVALVCAQCHVREAELFRASPKKALFDMLNMPECVTCHSNHKIEPPQDAWLGFTDGTVCGKCHDETIPGADVIKGDRSDLDQLGAAITTATARLAQAQQAGMIVDDGEAALREASDQRIQARVLVHTFAGKPVNDAAAKGLEAARKALADANGALAEVQYRRKGLAVATIFIAGFLITLWIKIRRLDH
jgi:Cytochrome c3